MTDSSGAQTIFRPSALAKIRSPEQLDALLPITSPVGWVALLAVALALAAAVAWGFFGTVIRTASGQAIIVRNSSVGILEVSGQASGTILEVLVEAGDVVHRGQMVARIDLSQMKDQVASGKEALAKLREQDVAQTRDEGERLRILQEKLSNQQSLFDRGLITKTPLLETKNAIYEVNARSFQRRQQILEQELKIRERQVKYDQENVIRSSHDGRVTEVVVSAGNFVQPGKAVVRLESLEGNYEAVVYVPSIEGKKIKPGMAVRLAPSIIKPEEYGFVLGTVQWVSSFPVTREYLMNELADDDRLVEALLHNGTAIELVVDLALDPSTPTGYRWSSSRGPDTTLESGTLCQASVVLEHVRPITLLVPFLKKQAGIF